MRKKSGRGVIENPKGLVFWSADGACRERGGDGGL
jgi:hypothetical protein